MEEFLSTFEGEIKDGKVSGLLHGPPILSL